MSNGGASRSKSAEALRPCTARSVSVSAITAARTWDNRRLPTRSKQRRGLRMLAASRMAFEPLLESGDLRAERSARSGTKKSDHRHRRLLRPRRERPRGHRAVESRDEFATPHAEHRGPSSFFGSGMVRNEGQGVCRRVLNKYS